MKVLALLSILLLTSCMVIKVPQPTGGSKSDGIVELSYERYDLEIIEINYQEAKINALRVCNRWGFDNADMFGGSIKDCSMHDSYGGCMKATITIKYQCY